MTFASLQFRMENTASRLRARLLDLRGIRTGPLSTIRAGARVARTWLGGYGEISLGAGCDVREYAIIESWGGRVVVGRNAFIGPHAVLYGHGGIEIGDDVLVSMHVRILSSNHCVPDQGTLIRSQADILLPTRIGNDVWLGAGATVLGGITIGDGCVVGAGAVVVDDLPPHAIAAGVPARVLKTRPDRLASGRK